MRFQIRLFFELLYIMPVGAGKKLPVDIADRIAGKIRTMLGEFDAEAMIGRFMQTGDKSFDDEFRDEFEIAEFGDDLGSEIIGGFGLEGVGCCHNKFFLMLES